MRFLRLFTLLVTIVALKSQVYAIDPNGQSHADSKKQAVIKDIWLTEDGRAKVNIGSCANNPAALCGKIVWLKEPLDKAGKPKVDKENPDESLQSRPLMGLEILQDFVQSEDSNEWVDGTIYSPKEGSTYSCKINLLEENPNKLRVRGYVLFPALGKTQIWTRAQLESQPHEAANNHENVGHSNQESDE
ncbi:DUF2147 domain-containing protein [Candidatus Nucleicultrix amoebiphila]|jgi:uncharacterized protein (DUF2147 family)|uniref:DUF2147 domain-containing protein n=1 Tax=Candidatus Nucleicultrix amoebiphila TaxID=1509244 RepID=UPI000A26F817|nr:DUF2147 domain-containing protein [Candidatus Nucleicultrix amoebiphila]